MITYNIFLWSGIFILFMLLYQTIRYIFALIKYAKRYDTNSGLGGIPSKEIHKPEPYLVYLWKGLSFQLSIVAAVIFVLSLTFGHIVPYLAQQRDHMLIMEYNDNIALYQEYSEDYAEAARQQIEQYQQMQSEMARTATIQQLQFFAEQEDSVGNSLTNEIRRFQELIMEQELAINKAHSRVIRRPLNIWYFGIEPSNQE